MYKSNFTFNHKGDEQKMDETSKTLQREIKIAKKIQSTLLNGEKQEFEGGEVTGSSIPARLIGGDYYDFYPLVNGKIRIVIGDVMGKGIPAAMLMILTRGAFRTAAESTQSPSETLYAMNQALYKDLRALKSFVTLFCADWDPNTGILTYANAGHNLPLHIGAQSQEVTPLEHVSDVMVGGLPDQTYQQGALKLDINDTVFLYTDGIVEAQNETGEQYQMKRLKDILKVNQNKGVEDIQEEVLKSIDGFTGSEPQKDDITMVVLKVGSHQSNITSYNSPVIN